MTTYTITNIHSGMDMGTYEAADETAALDMLARDVSGYDTWADYMAATTDEDEDAPKTDSGVRVTEA